MYEENTHTFEFSTDIKMATSSIVDEVTEATGQTTESYESVAVYL
jgi:hypothetical protein